MSGLRLKRIVHSLLALAVAAASSACLGRQSRALTQANRFHDEADRVKLRLHLTR